MIFLKQSEIILDNQKKFIDLMHFAAYKIEKLFETKDYTWTYPKYNIFCLTATNKLMYELFNELKKHIREHIDDRPLWIQSWLNLHKNNEVLDWHNHLWKWHGYISIDPKNTKTIFEEWEIENKIGQIYFGEGYIKHKVEVVEPYDGYRITLGFDVTDGIPQENGYNSLIPI